MAYKAFGKALDMAGSGIVAFVLRRQFAFTNLLSLEAL